MSDIIDLESALSDTEYEIEQYSTELNRYDSLVSYSTVTLTLREVYRLSNEEVAPLTFSQRLGSAFSTGLERGIDALEDLLIGLARNWMTLSLLVIAILLIVAILKRTFLKKWTNRKSQSAFKDDTDRNSLSK